MTLGAVRCEGIMANHSIPRESLETLSIEMLPIYPAESVRTSIHLGAAAKPAIILGTAYDMNITKDAKLRVKESPA